MEQLNKKLNILNKQLNNFTQLESNEMNRFKIINQKLKELNDVIVKLDKHTDKYESDEMYHLNRLVGSNNMKDITCTDAPPVITTENGTTYYKWVQISSLGFNSIIEPSVDININFTYLVDGVLTQYKKKDDVNSDNVIYVKNGTVDHIKMPVDWFPASQACYFGFQIALTNSSGVTCDFHFASTYPETG